MKKSLLPAFVILGMMIGCNDHVEEIASEPEASLTHEQQSQIAVMKQTQSILGEIILDKNVRAEIISEASLKFDGDNNAHFSMLLGKSEKNSRTSSNFSSAFRQAVQSRQDNARTTDLISDLEKEILDDNLVIYAPYYDEFNWEEVKEVTITYHPLVRDDYNEGMAFGFDSNFSNGVLVDDDYAFENPTLIIKPADGETTFIPEEDEQGNPNGRVAASTINQLSVGWVKCTKQYDGLFGGGSEFKFCIIGGKVTDFTKAESFESILSINLSRKDIRKERWKKFYYELDDDWKSPEDSRKFGLIEYDKNKTKHELKFSAKVQTKNGDGTFNTEVLAEYKLTMESQEGWIKTDTYDSRTSFAAFNKSDMGHGTKDDYRIYRSGDVRWTLPLREFTN